MNITHDTPLASFPDILGSLTIRIPPPFGTPRHIVQAIESHRIRRLGALAAAPTTHRGKRAHWMMAAAGVACTMAAAIIGAYTRHAPPLQPPPQIAYAPTANRAVGKPVAQAMAARPVMPSRMARAARPRNARLRKLARTAPPRLAARAAASIDPQAAMAIPSAHETLAHDAPIHVMPMVAHVAPGASIAPIHIELQRHTRLID